MIDLLEYAFMQRAFLAGLMVAVICAALGVFLVLRRLSLIGDGLAHVAFGGLALGFLLGLSPILTALVLAVISSLWMYSLHRHLRIYGETAIGILIAAGLGLGVVILSVTHGFNADLFSFLFGSILTVTQQDLLLTLGLGVIVLACISTFYKELIFISFDEEGAQAAGIPVRGLTILLNALTAITIVISIRLVGVLLVSALIVVPVAAALQIAKSFFQAMIYSGVFAILSVMIGLTAAFYLDLAAGGAIVLSAVLLFCAVSAVQKING